MKSVAIIFALVLASASFSVTQTIGITADDLRMLEGAKWSGTLTYLDYSSNKKTSIRSKLTVRRSPEHSGLWWFDYEYPDEPKGNSSSSSTLINDGKVFFDQNVIEKTGLPDKTLRIITTRPGEDNDKKAVFRYTYLIGKDKLLIRKEVQTIGTTEWFERSEYSWTR